MLGKVTLDTLTAIVVPAPLLVAAVRRFVIVTVFEETEQVAAEFTFDTEAIVQLDERV